jgi:exodeoxyribonuclease V alpha subunit
MEDIARFVMQIYGTFSKFIRRNEKSGYSCFTVRANNYGTIMCNGIVQSYPKSTPLYIEGEFENIEGNNVLVINNIKACGYNYDISEIFLCSGYFDGIGETVARKIVSAIADPDIFKFIRNYDVDNNTFKVNGVSANTIVSFVRKTKFITDFEDLINFLNEYGGEYCNAGKLYKKYGNNSIKMIKDNPYTLLYGGASFSVCEKMAISYGFISCDKRRIKSVVEHAMSLERNNGNTKISFNNLCKRIKYLEKSSESPFSTNPLFVGEEILKGEYKIDESRNDDIYIYTNEDYANESIIAEGILRLISSKAALKDIVPVDDIEDICKVSYSEEQKKAFEILKETGVNIITGGPGTGKTTVLNGILKKYELDNPYKEILLCGPTGCAARHMSESTNREAFTIHKVLGIRPFENGEYEPLKAKLTADCIVVDESSMIDTDIMAKLLSSIKNGALLILLGDQEQLPSIGSGDVFKDLIECGIIPCTHFTKIFRQNKDNPIINNSKKVAKGDKMLISDNKFKIKRFDSEEEMVNYAKWLGDYCNKKEIEDIKFYTPSRNKKFLSGTINMNRVLQSSKKNSDEYITFGLFNFYRGDKIIFNRNNYEAGYYNGQEGIIVDIQEHNNMQYITVSTDEGRIYLSGSDIDDIELGYIMTAHKSQGGECKNAIILVPLNPASLLKRQLLYVEITRAKESVMILSEKDALERAISDKYEYKRSTGLKEKLISGSEFR